jgi:hypothetical protein
MCLALWQSNIKKWVKLVTVVTFTRIQLPFQLNRSSNISCNKFWFIVVRRDIDQRNTYSYVFGRRIYDHSVRTCMNESYLVTQQTARAVSDMFIVQFHHHLSQLEKFADILSRGKVVISFGPSWFDETLIKGIHILMFSEEEYMTTV